MTIVVLVIFWFRTYNVFFKFKLASTKTLLYMWSSFNALCLNFSVLMSKIDLVVSVTLVWEKIKYSDQCFCLVWKLLLIYFMDVKLA